MVTTGCPRLLGPEPPFSHAALIKTRLRNINPYTLHLPLCPRLASPTGSQLRNVGNCFLGAWGQSLVQAHCSESHVEEKEGKGDKGLKEILQMRKSSGEVKTGLACWGTCPRFEHCQLFTFSESLGKQLNLSDLSSSVTVGSEERLPYGDRVRCLQSIQHSVWQTINTPCMLMSP